MKGDKCNLPDLLHQIKWIFNQRLDYLKIPSISKAADANNIKAPSELLIPNNDTFERINIDRISHINVEDHYCRIFVKHQESIKDFFVNISLKKILDQLPQEFFLQIHRSHIVNLAYVSSLIKDSRSYQLALNQGAHTLPISRYRLPRVLSVLEKFIG